MSKRRQRRSHPIKDRLKLAKAYLRRRFLSSPVFIAVTGSCGKTSTTHFLARILETQAPCLIGIDRNTRERIVKTLLDARPTHGYVVQEMSAHAPGAIAEASLLYRPQVAIVTTIGQDHYTKFRTLEATAMEKARLVRGLPPSGVAVLNIDDPLVYDMARSTRAHVLTFGEHADADIRGDNVVFTWPGGLSLDISHRGKTVHLQTQLFGALWVHALLAAIGGAMAAGVSFVESVTALDQVEAYNRRMSVHRLPSGGWLVNDTFKAPYWSIAPALDVMKCIVAPRKTIVLGAFSDAPGASSPKYRLLARQALEIADRVLFVGEKSRHVEKLLKDDLRSRLFVMKSAEQACRFLAESAVADELVFVKANINEHLERLLYGQSGPVACWKETCPLQLDCKDCNESGIRQVPSAE